MGGSKGYPVEVASAWCVAEPLVAFAMLKGTIIPSTFRRIVRVDVPCAIRPSSEKNL